MSPDEFKFACSFLDDHRNLIAAGKTQRWEIVKWAVALNVGLATAAVAIDRKIAALMIFGFCLMVMVLALILIFYVNYRMTGARNNAAHLYRWLQNFGIDCQALVEKDLLQGITWRYDLPELLIYTLVLFLSCGPSLIVFLQVPIKMT